MHGSGRDSPAGGSRASTSSTSMSNALVPSTSMLTHTTSSVSVSHYNTLPLIARSSIKRPISLSSEREHHQRITVRDHFKCRAFRSRAKTIHSADNGFAGRSMVGSGLFAPSSAAIAAGLNPLADHLMRTQASASSAAGRNHRIANDLFSHQRSLNATSPQNAFFHDNMVVVDEDDDGDIDVDEDVCGDEVEDVVDGDYLQVSDERKHLFHSNNEIINNNNNNNNNSSSGNNNNNASSAFASPFDLFKLASITSPASIGTASSSFTKLTSSAGPSSSSSSTSGTINISSPLERIRQLQKQSISALVNNSNNNDVAVDNDQKKMFNLLVSASTSTEANSISSISPLNTFKPIRELPMDFEEEEEEDEEEQQSSSPCFEDLEEDAEQHQSTLVTCRKGNNNNTSSPASHIPTDEEKAQFQRSLSSATSLVFHRRAGLPLTSSPVSTNTFLLFDYRID